MVAIIKIMIVNYGSGNYAFIWIMVVEITSLIC